MWAWVCQCWNDSLRVPLIWLMANWCNLHAGYMESHFCMLLYTLEDTFVLNNNVLDYFTLFLLVRSCSYLVFSIFCRNWAISCSLSCVWSHCYCLWGWLHSLVIFCWRSIYIVWFVDFFWICYLTVADISRCFSIWLDSNVLILLPDLQTFGVL